MRIKVVFKQSQLHPNNITTKTKRFSFIQLSIYGWLNTWHIYGLQRMLPTFILELGVAKYFIHTNNGKMVGSKPSRQLVSG